MSNPDQPENLRQMIRSVSPQLCLSGNIDRVFDEVAEPKFVYNFIVSLDIHQIRDLLAWMVEAKMLEAANAAIQAGGSKVPAQLMLEFIKAAGEIQGRK